MDSSKINTEYYRSAMVQAVTVEVALPYDHQYDFDATQLPSIEDWQLCYFDYRNDIELTLVYETYNYKRTQFNLIKELNSWLSKQIQATNESNKTFNLAHV